MKVEVQILGKRNNNCMNFFMVSPMFRNLSEKFIKLLRDYGFINKLF